MSGYWFAKRDRVRGKMQPVSREGWLVGLGFAAAMLLGGLGFALLAVNGNHVLGVILFVTTAVVAGTSFIVIAAKTCDPVNTVEDYRQGRVARSVK